jgi:hypothetical protein
MYRVAAASQRRELRIGLVRAMTSANETVMTADRNGLGFLGFIFGGVTAAVMVMAATVVFAHVEGTLSLEAPAIVAQATTTASVQR